MIPRSIFKGSIAPTKRSLGVPILTLVAACLVSSSPAQAQNWQSSPVLTKFTQELRAPGLIPVALPDGTRTWPGAVTSTPLVADHYTIDINQYTDQLHPDLPATTLWGYNPSRALGVPLGGTVTQKHLGGILIAQRGRPTQITFRNNLPNSHILPVDTSIEGSGVTATHNRTSVHLHGGLVPWFSDGGPFAFWDAQGNTGSTFSIGNQVLRAGQATPVNYAEYYYPNDQSARMAWYHDHSMGITRLNAYAGIASAYIIRDNFEAQLARAYGLPKFVENGGRELPLVFQDKIFQNATVPALPFPGSAKGHGNLWYPYQYDPLFWGNSNAPAVSVVPEAFGDTMLVNGAAYPKATVDPRRYRFRILNACNARVLNLQLYEESAVTPGQPDFTKPGPNWVVIGTEGGFLAKPVSVPSAKLNITVDQDGARSVNPAAPGGSLITAPGERLDVVVDFAGKGGKKYILYNDAPGPYPNGGPENDYPNANGIGDTSVFMRFEIKADSPAIAADVPFYAQNMPLAGHYLSKIDRPLAGPVAGAAASTLNWVNATTAPLPIPTRAGVTVRRLTLNEILDGQLRLAQMLGTNVATYAGDFSRPYGDPNDVLSAATETPTAGATEVWEIANLTGDTHPIHFHLVNAQILSRQPFDVLPYLAAAPGDAILPTFTGPARGPAATELGWKETIQMHPEEVTTVIMKFDLPKVPFTVPVSPRTGGHEYVWHCHILEHEEHDMMRSLVVQ